jgi:hypothetical protein
LDVCGGTARLGRNHRHDPLHGRGNVTPSARVRAAEDPRGYLRSSAPRAACRGTAEAKPERKARWAAAARLCGRVAIGATVHSRLPRPSARGTSRAEVAIYRPSGQARQKIRGAILHAAKLNTAGRGRARRASAALYAFCGLRS